MSISLDTLALPPDLHWADEFEWSVTESAQEYAVTGALVVDAATKLAGRPITLQAADDRAWITRELLGQIHALTQPAGRVMALTINGASFSVIWRPGAQAIDAQPIFPLANPQNDLAYVVTLRFTEV